ncbi:MAG: hypothetical protein LUD77_01925 [Clostridiales bacterium]|nr:hypothetical protein [Clostridiales bacterium]
MSTVVKELETAMDEVFGESFTNAARENIGKFYEAMTPSVEELKSSMQGMETIPQAFADVFNQSSIIGAVGKNTEALKGTAVTTPITVLPADQTALMGASSKYADSYIEGIQSKMGEAQSAAETLRNTISNTLSQSLTANVKVAITAETTHIEGPTQSGSNTLSLNPYKHNATGTTYFGGGWTTINENGPEIVNLPTGTSILPADKSRKIGTGTTLHNTANLYFSGSLFGDEETADFIGNKVCEKLYDYVTAL